MTTNNKTIGLILLAATLLNLTRLLPVLGHPEVGFHNFPPVTTEQTLLITAIPGWFWSHLMGLLSVPLLLIGLIIIYDRIKPHDHATLWLSALVFIGFGMLCYSLAVGVDGWLLPQVADQYLQAEALGLKASLEASIVSTHNLALSMGGMSLATLPIGGGLLGLAMRRHEKLKLLGAFSIGYAILAIISLALGVADIYMHKNFLFTAGLMFAPTMIFFTLAILLLRNEDLIRH